MGIFTDNIINDLTFFGSFIIGDFPVNNEFLGETTECQCPFLVQCNFIRENRTKMSELVARIESRYCTKSACCRCARFRVAQVLGPVAMPPLMLPEQIDWARQIIEECGRDFKPVSQPAGAR
jgi:hypothetical protein